MGNENVSYAMPINPFETKSEYGDILSKLTDLRKDGENKIIALKNENREIKLNKRIEKENKAKIIESNMHLIEEAKQVKLQNKEEVNKLIAEAKNLSKEDGKKYFDDDKEIQDKRLAEAKQVKTVELAKEKEEHASRLQAIKDKHTKALGEVDQNDKKALAKLKETYRLDLKTERIFHSSNVNEIKSNYESVYQDVKDKKYNAFLSKSEFMYKARNSHYGIDEAIEHKARTYVYNFKLAPWAIKNALYIIVILFFLFSIIMATTQGKNLLTANNIMQILGQSSVKLFYTLGVAGLILLAGTDLSIGRMTGLGASFVNMLLSTTIYTSALGFTIDITGAPVGAQVIVAILMSVLLCTIFSAIAGFFSAKFKMHPFITTLSTQLLIFGLMQINYSSVAAFTMDSSVRNMLRGESYSNIIIMAVIAVIIVWFIWNKTKFGKNMYAVGGNAEAASVSGISVFWTTMGVFILAGILYGFGGFATALQGAGANANSGYGTELDAIAAAVIGGISFSGGIGKISGAVVGTIIFTGMTYCLTFLGYDPNIQYIFKGILIMAAVCLDSVKYLKKK